MEYHISPNGASSTSRPLFSCHYYQVVSHSLAIERMVTVITDVSFTVSGTTRGFYPFTPTLVLLNT